MNPEEFNKNLILFLEGKSLITKAKLKESKNTFTLDFKEGFMAFRVENTNFIIENYNIYSENRFNPNEGFKSLSQEIIRNLKIFLKENSFQRMIAQNIRTEAINFWESKCAFKLSEDKKQEFLNYS